MASLVVSNRETNKTTLIIIHTPLHHNRFALHAQFFIVKHDFIRLNEHSECGLGACAAAATVATASPFIHPLYSTNDVTITNCIDIDYCVVFFVISGMRIELYTCRTHSNIKPFQVYFKMRGAATFEQRLLFFGAIENLSVDKSNRQFVQLHIKYLNCICFMSNPIFDDRSFFRVSLHCSLEEKKPCHPNGNEWR